MTDPAHVNARIAAVMDRHQNHYRCVPEALAEAASLWGAGANEHGVFLQHERVEVARLSESFRAAVLIAEIGNGLFGHGLEYSFGMGGGECFPSVWREAFGTREEARAAGVGDPDEHIVRHPADKRQAELLRWVWSQGRVHRFTSVKTWPQASFWKGSRLAGHSSVSAEPRLEQMMSLPFPRR